MMMRLWLVVLALCLPVPAIASDWLRGESEQWIIHARLDEAELRALMTSLEDFSHALQVLLPIRTEPGQKLEIYLSDSTDHISRVSDLQVSSICMADAETPISYAWYDRTRPMRLRNWSLQHCIARFHISRAFLNPVPPWIRSGVPAFFATSYRAGNGSVILGAPDVQRPLTVPVYASELERMVLAKAPTSVQSEAGRWHDLSRELVTSLLIERRNSGKLERYLGAFGAGSTMTQSAAELGDLNALTKDIRERLRKGRWPTRVFATGARELVTVTIRPMRADEIALIDPRFERMHGRRHEVVARKLRALTAKHPESALAWYEYAAAEFARVRASGFVTQPVFRGLGLVNGEIVVTANPYSDAEAWRAVNTSLTLDPTLPQAIRLRAEISLLRLLQSGDLDDSAAFDRIRQELAPLARDPRRHPLAAALHYQCYVEQGSDPPAQAFQQLRDAFVSNAWNDDFRFAYAVALVSKGETDPARRLLTSLLNDPKHEAAARRALEPAQ